MTLEDLAIQFTSDLDFDVLMGWADILGVEHNENSWTDDEWLTKEDEIRDKITFLKQKAELEAM